MLSRRAVHDHRHQMRDSFIHLCVCFGSPTDRSFPRSLRRTPRFPPAPRPRKHGGFPARSRSGLWSRRTAREPAGAARSGVRNEPVLWLPLATPPMRMGMRVQRRRRRRWKQRPRGRGCRGVLPAVPTACSLLRAGWRGGRRGREAQTGVASAAWTMRFQSEPTPRLCHPPTTKKTCSGVLLARWPWALQLSRQLAPRPTRRSNGAMQHGCEQPSRV